MDEYIQNVIHVVLLKQLDTWIGNHPSASLKYRVLWSFRKASALSVWRRSSSCSFFTTKICNTTIKINTLWICCIFWKAPDNPWFLKCFDPFSGQTAEITEYSVLWGCLEKYTLIRWVQSGWCLWMHYERRDNALLIDVYRRKAIVPNI